MQFVKTEAGQRVMKDRSVVLTPRQRSAFILIDGKKTLEQVLESTAATGVTRVDLDRLMELGLIAKSEVTPKASETVATVTGSPTRAAPAAGGTLPSDAPRKTPQERYAEAYPIAIRITSSLGLRGFRLNLAVEGASSYEELMQVAPRILEAVGPERYQPLRQVLGAR